MPITDQMIYVVVAAHSGSAYLPEQNVSELDRASVVADIASGQFEGLVQVLECNPVEHVCSDVTEDIAREVMTAWANEGEPLAPWQHEFIERHVSVQAAASFRRAA